MTKITRYSKQRELIYQNLKARCDHPTAESIYSDLKVDNPGLSLGTVYRNLNFLVAANKIRKLDVGQSTVHFDADLSAHHHLFVIAVNKYLILLIVKILVMKCKNKLNIKLKKLNLFSVVFAKNV